MRSPSLSAICLVTLAAACKPSGHKFVVQAEEPGRTGVQEQAAASSAAPALVDANGQSQGAGSATPRAPVPNQPQPSPAKATAADGVAASGTGQVSAVALQEARHFYAQRCSLCHGPNGQGDGVAAKNLRPTPRSFRDPAWQAKARDQDIELIIVRGGSALGRSMMMPASTDLADKPQMVRALTAVVRSFNDANDP